MWNETEDEESVLLPEEVAFFAALFVLSPIIITSCALVLLASIRCPHLRSPSHILVCSLACADMLVGMSAFHFPLIRILRPTSMIGCLSAYFPAELSTNASIITLATIAVDKYICITRPLHYPSIVTRRRLVLLIAFSWALAFSIAIPFMTANRWHEHGICEFNSLFYPEFYRFPSIAYFVMVTLLLLMYARIFHIARKQSNNNTRCSRHVGADTAVSKRYMRTLGMVTGGFVMFWAPYYTLVMTMSLLRTPSRTLGVWIYVTLVFAFSNSAINTAIYAWNHSLYRREFKQILCGSLLKRTYSGISVQRSSVQMHRNS